MNIGQRIKERRIELGLSVDDVAEKIGKNRATVYRYESNEIEDLPTSVLEPLAKALEVTPNYILGTGIFKKWDQIKNNKERIIELIKDWFNGILPFEHGWNDNTLFIQLTDTLIGKIEFEGDNITIYPKVPQDFFFMNESIVSTKIDKNDAKKQRLINNFELLNEDGQEDLLDYSEMLAGNPRKIKESDKNISLNA